MPDTSKQSSVFSDPETQALHERNLEWLRLMREDPGWVLSRLYRLSELEKIDWNSHEGMVTVYDRDGRYMGCMGVERWHRLLAEDGAVRVGPNQDSGAGDGR